LVAVEFVQFPANLISLLGCEVRNLIKDFRLAHAVKLAQLRGFVSANFISRPLRLFSSSATIYSGEANSSDRSDLSDTSDPSDRLWTPPSQNEGVAFLRGCVSFGAAF